MNPHANAIRLIVGLGNVGHEYEGTRHNCGFIVLDRLLSTLGTTRDSGNELYLWSQAVHTPSGSEIILAWPKTMVNRSGEAVASLLARTGHGKSSLLVVTDDFNLPLGRIRFRQFGSDGGHNGLRSIIETLGSEVFFRLRLGIGPVPDGTSNTDFVLGQFGKDELETAEKMFDIASEAVIFALTNRFDEVMKKFNS